MSIKPVYLIAGAAVAAVGLGIYLVKKEIEPPSDGSDTESWTYRGVPYQVAYFSDWYNGTGWRFRYINGVPGFARGSTAWAGVFTTKAEAAASAEYTIDMAG